MEVSSLCNFSKLCTFFVQFVTEVSPGLLHFLKSLVTNSPSSRITSRNGVACLAKLQRSVSTMARYTHPNLVVSASASSDFIDFVRDAVTVGRISQCVTVRNTERVHRSALSPSRERESRRGFVPAPRAFNLRITITPSLMYGRARTALT